MRLTIQQGRSWAAAAMLSILWLTPTDAPAAGPTTSDDESVSADTGILPLNADPIPATALPVGVEPEPSGGDNPAGTAANAESNTHYWARFQRLLSDLAIPHDPRDLEAAALRAMLFRIDRHAALLSADEAEQQRRRNQGWMPSGDTRHPATDAAFDPASTSPDDRPATWTSETWPHEIVYVNMHGFYPDAPGTITNILNQAATGNVAGLILDLRQAGGRDFDAIDRVAGYFLDPESPLYTVQTHDGQILRSGKAQPGDHRIHTPTLLITGGQTAEAAELLAAVLRNASGVMLLGDRTRGDPLLRELHQWSDGDYLYLPVARMVPHQHPDYEMVGVVPHVIIRPPRSPATSRPPVETSQVPNGEPEFPETVYSDPVLSRAVDIIIGLHAVSMPSS